MGRGEVSQELHSFYRLPTIVRVIQFRRWIGHVARMEEHRIAFKMVAGKTTGNRPLGRPKCEIMDKFRIEPKNQYEEFDRFGSRQRIIAEPL